MIFCNVQNLSTKIYKIDILDQVKYFFTIGHETKTKFTLFHSFFTNNIEKDIDKFSATHHGRANCTN